MAVNRAHPKAVVSFRVEDDPVETVVAGDDPRFQRGSSLARWLHLKKYYEPKARLVCGHHPPGVTKAQWKESVQDIVRTPVSGQ